MYLVDAHKKGPENRSFFMGDMYIFRFLAAGAAASRAAGTIIHLHT